MLRNETYFYILIFNYASFVFLTLLDKYIWLCSNTLQGTLMSIYLLTAVLDFSIITCLQNTIASVVQALEQAV